MREVDEGVGEGGDADAGDAVVAEADDAEGAAGADAAEEDEEAAVVERLDRRAAHGELAQAREGGHGRGDLLQRVGLRHQLARHPERGGGKGEGTRARG